MSYVLAVEADELARRRAEVVVLDVRWPNEWEAGHIDGALHVPSDYLYDYLNDHLETLDRSRPIITVCRSGDRSVTAVEILASEGFTADSLEGGVLAWLESGHPLVDASGGPGEVVAGEPPADDRPPEMKHLEEAFLDALFAVQEYFGDHEPTDAEVREFLRNRLIGDGRTPEEADRILDGKA